MADGTKISWAEATWNPITGCDVLSPGCTNCYAMRYAGTRGKHLASRKGLTTQTKTGPVWNGEVRFNEDWLTQPLRWRKPRMIFVVAHGDLFYERVPDEWIDRVFAVMALAPQHTFQVLTKRAGRMRAYFDGIEGAEWRNGFLGTTWHRRQGVRAALHDLGGKRRDLLGKIFKLPLPNVWLGVSVEDQARADERIPLLLDTPAAVRWISAEPLLSELIMQPEDLGDCPLCDGRGYYFVGQHEAGCNVCKGRKLDWIVAGGESAQNKPGRPMHPDWARSLRDQCRAAGVAFHMKQMSNKLPIPEDLQIREWPT